MRRYPHSWIGQHRYRSSCQQAQKKNQEAMPEQTTFRFVWNHESSSPRPCLSTNLFGPPDAPHLILLSLCFVKVLCNRRWARDADDP